MPFEFDAFISYTHLDNVGLVDSNKGWITSLHRALEIRVGQLLGKAPHIWRDPKLQGNDVFADVLTARLYHVALLLAVVSPRYLKSDWARREIDTFCQAAEEEGGLRVGDRIRIFKILKTPTRLESHPPEIRDVLGYEFFRVDPDTGRIREFDEAFGPDAQREFWLKLDDLAHDICDLLETMDLAPIASVEHAEHSPAIFLAEVTTDMREYREALKRSLQQFGYRIFPDAVIPFTATEAEAELQTDLEACQMSVHLIGKTFGFVPEGTALSLPELQNDLATKRSHECEGFSRILWLPPSLVATDERQARFLDRLRHDPELQPGSDLLETHFEELQTTVTERLVHLEEKRTRAPGKDAVHSTNPQVYLVYDSADAQVVSPCADYLFDQGCEVLHPQFDGDESDIRKQNEENFCECDGVLLFFGSGNEAGIRRKLREIQKSAGYGRTKATPVVAVCLIGLPTPEKERFRTHEGILIRQTDALNTDNFASFLSGLKTP